MIGRTARSNVPAALSRRQWVKDVSTAAAAMLVPSALSGCVASSTPDQVDRVWGRRGLSDGRFLKPRAITIDPMDQLYIVDTTGRIQKFDADGKHLRTWKTPDTANGRPTGLAFDTHWHQEPSNESNEESESKALSGRLLVADTHYYRMLVFTPEGVIRDDSQIGGVSGHEPGEFAFVTDAVTDRFGCIYIGEYGDSDRIQKFSPEGEFLTQWGGTGSDAGKFLRPQSLVIVGDRLWIADACNHRIQCFDISEPTPRLVRVWGSEGRTPGELYYPYDLAIDEDGTVIVCEYGNQRLQRFSPDGKLLSMWGGPGHAEGQLYQPWGVVIDSQRRVHILDSNNHRVQRVVGV